MFAPIWITIHSFCFMCFGSTNIQKVLTIISYIINLHILQYAQWYQSLQYGVLVNISIIYIFYTFLYFLHQFDY